MICLILLFFVTSQAFCYDNYRRHKLLSAIPRNQNQLKSLMDLSKDEKIDIWMFSADVNQKMEFRADPKVAKKVENFLKSKRIEYRTVTNDIQKWIDEEKMTNPPSNYGSERKIPLDTYHTLDTIYDRLEFLGKRHSGLVKVKEIGITYEKNPIKGAIIGSPGSNKPAVFLECGIHAREWVSPATCVYIIEQLVKGHKNDEEIKEMVKAFDWYIFPVVNPDGYNYSFTERLWRKNRSPPANNSKCVGVDLNRNFGAYFAGPGTSGDSCSEIYRGSSPFCEAETLALRDTVKSIGKNLKLYISIHSFSQLIMCPYGSKKSLPSDYKELMEIMKAATTALKKVHGKVYRYGAISHVLSQFAAGSTIDWTYDVAKIKYSFSLELRDKGQHGFILPKNEIIPTAEESFAAIKVMAKMVKAKYQRRNK